jgi:diguanylate cyclase (GGDEF)-like protein/PAS domain S-box-containing protein
VNFLSHLTIRILLGSVLLLALSSAFASETKVSIGVLSFRPLEQTQRQWQPTVDYLNQHVTGYHFTLTVMYYKELDLAVNRGDFDFVFTNPEHYVSIRADHSLNAITTMMPLAEGHPVTQFGGVILTRADRDDISTLEDVRGKIVASPAELSLGGYLMQRWTLYKHDVDITELGSVHFTGMPHDKVVMEVLDRKADVGFVRTGILESLAREGKIKLDQFKVINRQPENSFPQRYSTDLYPEWPLAVMPEVSEKLVKQVNLALLSIQPDDVAAQEGQYFGFAPAGNYAAVEAMMTRLKVNPKRTHEFNLRDVLRKYALEVVGAGFVLLLSMVATAMFLVRKNRQLSKSYLERDKLDEELRLANASLETKVSQRTQELQESESRFRLLFERHSSPMLLIDPDNGAIINANSAAGVFYGYPVERMQAMNIAQINTQTASEIAEERLQAQHDERNYFVFLHRLANGELRNVEVYSSPIEVDGRPALFSIVHDITERKQLETQMHGLAFYDALTKLPNRRLLLDRLNKALISCTRTQRHGALLFLDLDNFKSLNDLHGHDMGDLLLIEAASRILNCIRLEDSAARFGGDEFVVMLEGLSESLPEAVVQAEIVAEKVREALAIPYQLGSVEADMELPSITHHCSSSIGVTIFRDHDESLDQLLKWTDMAMYRAKEAGRNAIRFFDPAMQTSIEMRAALENDLRVALEQGQFRLFFQVQVNAHNRPQGAEVLLRWIHPERGMVSPAQFIPLAEETGLILPIGAWVLETACAQIKRWESRLPFRNLTLAVNVSAKQFRLPDFVAQVQSAIARHAINPMSLKLELTESLVLDNVDDTIAKMKKLKDIGVSFSMDDFGTGYSSLSYLKRLPLSQLKIDQSFVRELATDHGDMVMVMTIVDLAMNFELDVIAEGVETEVQFKLLHRYGCTSFQGYLFSKPVPVEDFEVFILHLLLK